MDYARAATNIQTSSTGGDAETIPNAVKAAMTRPAKAQWNVTDPGQGNGKPSNVQRKYRPADDLSLSATGHKLVGVRWVYYYGGT